MRSKQTKNDAKKVKDLPARKAGVKGGITNVRSNASTLGGGGLAGTAQVTARL
jgi:hypothetical protein